MTTVGEGQDDRPSKKTQRTIVDRTICPILPNSVKTPSFRDGVSPQVERLHRLHGTSLLKGAAVLLKQGPSTFATACTIFHRFYHATSLLEKDVWSVAMASTVLAGKVEEEPRPIRHVVLMYNHLYRRRRLIVQEDGPSIATTVTCSALAQKLTKQEKENILRYTPSMSILGPTYAIWRKALVDTENLILRALGFTLYWIPDSHPHRYILYFTRILQISSEDFAQQAWSYCNASCFMDLATRYPPELIACAAIFLAARNGDIELPELPEKQHWWQAFCSDSNEQDMAVVCNATLGLSNPNNEQVREAFTTFVPSLVEDGSFNDPDSFLWSQGD